MKECGALLWPPPSNCRWNSMLVSLRKMTQESVWSSVMTVLTQARIEASDSASAPPLVMVKREQVVDILGLLEPFEEALQVLLFLNTIRLCSYAICPNGSYSQYIQYIFYCYDLDSTRKQCVHLLRHPLPRATR